MKKLKLFVIFSLLCVSGFAQSSEQTIDSLLNEWHKAAATAQFEKYFGIMHSDFVYLGTDPKERWNKETFAQFCKPYFDQGKGWDFKKISRNILLSTDGKIAWFDEHIDTWMKDCRGSGVLLNENGSWKLVQYNLTVLIENEKINEFIELRSK